MTKKKVGFVEVARRVGMNFRHNAPPTFYSPCRAQTHLLNPVDDTHGKTDIEVDPFEHALLLLLGELDMAGIGEDLGGLVELVVDLGLAPLELLVGGVDVLLSIQLRLGVELLDVLFGRHCGECVVGPSCLSGNDVYMLRFSTWDPTAPRRIEGLSFTG